jgi:hypothetical protein
MFQQSYTFSKVYTTLDSSCSEIKEKSTYKFTNDLGSVYLVDVEKYGYDVYIIKFYKKIHEKHKNKFNILTGEKRASRIIRTCIDIILEIKTKNNLASFGFMGAELPDEAKENTKRYRVYSKVSMNIFGSDFFHHVKSDKYSVYLFVNKNKTQDIEGFVKSIESMFSNIYPDLIF